MGADLSRVRGIVISHEHADHTRGAPAVSRRLGLPVFVSKTTHDTLRRQPARRRPRSDREDDGPRATWADLYLVEHFEPGATLSFGGLTMRTFPVEHDAEPTVGFVLSWSGLRLGVATDVGRPTFLLEEELQGCDALIVEANHDLGMLREGPYPWHLKQRIGGDKGHLSNVQCAALLTRLVHPGLSCVVLAHLSETNNTPDHAREAVRDCLATCGETPRLVVARQDEPVRLGVGRRLKEAAV